MILKLTNKELQSDSDSDDAQSLQFEEEHPKVEYIMHTISEANEEGCGTYNSFFRGRP